MKQPLTTFATKTKPFHTIHGIKTKDYLAKTHLLELCEKGQNFQRDKRNKIKEIFDLNGNNLKSTRT